MLVATCNQPMARNLNSGSPSTEFLQKNLQLTAKDGMKRAELKSVRWLVMGRVPGTIGIDLSWIPQELLDPNALFIDNTLDLWNNWLNVFFPFCLVIIFCPGRFDQFSQLQKLIPSDNFKVGAAVLAGTLLINPEIPPGLHRSTTTHNLAEPIQLYRFAKYG